MGGAEGRWRVEGAEESRSVHRVQFQLSSDQTEADSLHRGGPGVGGGKPNRVRAGWLHHSQSRTARATLGMELALAGSQIKGELVQVVPLGSLG